MRFVVPIILFLVLLVLGAGYYFWPARNTSTTTVPVTFASNHPDYRVRPGEQSMDLYQDFARMLLDKNIKLYISGGTQYVGSFSGINIVISDEFQPRYPISMTPDNPRLMLVSMDMVPNDQMLDIIIYIDNSGTVAKADAEVSFTLSWYLEAIRQLVTFNEVNDIPLNAYGAEHTGRVNIGDAQRNTRNLYEQNGTESLPIIVTKIK